MKVQANGLSFHVMVSGPADGETVVLHHPLANNLSCWDELTAALEGRFRVVRFDARGHGLSAVLNGPYSFNELAADVLHIMDAVGVGRAHFLGLSMGGMVGQVLGLQHAARFHSLCLVSTTSQTPPAAKSIWADRVVNVTAGGMETAVDGSMPRWVAPAVLTENPALVTRLKTMIRTTPPAGYIGWCQAIHDLDLTAQLGAIKLPTCVIVGALDPATPPAAAEVIHQAIPASQMIVMPDVSHMLHVEAPAQFATHVRAFLEQHRAV
jgi:3-oxoadipate enol-lactonase